MVKSRGDLAFTVKGFSNWKDGTIGIKKHEGSGSHKETLQEMIVIPSTCHGVGQHKQEKKNVTVPGKRDHLGNFFKIELLLQQERVGFELQNALHI